MAKTNSRFQIRTPNCPETYTCCPAPPWNPLPQKVTALAQLLEMLQCRDMVLFHINLLLPVNHKKNYTTLADLLSDDGFLSWYFHDNLSFTSQWNAWVVASPGNKLLAEQAVNLLEAVIEVDKREAVDRQAERSFEKLVNKMIDEGKLSAEQIKTSNHSW